MQISSPDELRLQNGSIDFRKLGRLLTEIENSQDRAAEILETLYRENNHCEVIGITGAPGAGKSSLTDCVISEYRAQGKTVAVVAIDPSSPFSGGAILGDRIRMGTHATDSGVFIRSMGSRGNLGGLAPATIDMVHCLRSVGFDAVIVETVGVGQSEIDVMHITDTVLLVMVPGLGDDVQALKAGIMEIADVFVVNKADRDGKERLIAEINMIISLIRDRLEWVPPIVETVAIERRGIEKLMEQIAVRKAFLGEHHVRVKREKILSQFKRMTEEKVGGNILAILENNGILQNWTDAVLSGNLNPYTALREIDRKLKITWEAS